MLRFSTRNTRAFRCHLETESALNHGEGLMIDPKSYGFFFSCGRIRVRFLLIDATFSRIEFARHGPGVTGR